MNKSDRTAAAEKLQKAHDFDDDRPMAWRGLLTLRNRCAKVLTLLAEAERENEVHEIEFGFLHRALNVPDEPQETTSERLLATAYKYADAERENDKLRKGLNSIETIVDKIRHAMNHEIQNNYTLYLLDLFDTETGELLNQQEGE